MKQLAPDCVVYNIKLGGGNSNIFLEFSSAENLGKIFTHFDEHIISKGLKEPPTRMKYPSCDPWDMAYLPTKRGSLFGVNVGNFFSIH